MSRWLPDTLAGRTTLILVAGMLTVIALGAWASIAGMSRSDMEWGGGFAGGVIAFAAAAQRLPPRARPQLIAAAHDIGAVIRPVDGVQDQVIDADGFTRGIARQLRQTLAPLGVKTLAVGHLRPVDAGRHWWSPHGPIVARIALRGGARFDVIRPGSWSPWRLVTDVGPLLLVLGFGLTALAVWVSRRATQPLSRFSAAAARLGADTVAPPLSETGPREIRAAARALNASRERIRRLIDDRTQMLAAIAHDLRTPIMRLRLRAEFIEGAGEREKIDRDLKEMETMISAAIGFAREEATEEPSEDFDLAAVLRLIRDELTDSGYAVALDAPMSIPFTGRRQALKRAFSNLIENAAKYGHRAEICVEPPTGEVIVTIDDRGPGIPPDEQEKVFTPFYRVERSRSRDTGGAGLGLALARTVIRAHGGDITLADRPERGLRQTIVLPL